VVGLSRAPVQEAPPSHPRSVARSRSISPGGLVCLEDGKTFKSLKRHLSVEHGLTPEAYRRKWDLPIDFPMVAPAYARHRSELARATGLGHHKRRRKSNTKDATGRSKPELRGSSDGGAGVSLPQGPMT